MLVISRRVGEGLLLGNVALRVERIGRNRVKLLIQAPHGVEIRRGEQVETERQNILASSLGGVPDRLRELHEQVLKAISAGPATGGSPSDSRQGRNVIHVTLPTEHRADESGAFARFRIATQWTRLHQSGKPSEADESPQSTVTRKPDGPTASQAKT